MPITLVTSEPLTVVRLRDSGGSIMAGPMTCIPRDSRIAILGKAPLDGMVELAFHTQRFAAFEIDIRERCIEADHENWRQPDPLPS